VPGVCRVYPRRRQTQWADTSDEGCSNDSWRGRAGSVSCRSDLSPAAHAAGSPDLMATPRGAGGCVRSCRAGILTEPTRRGSTVSLLATLKLAKRLLFETDKRLLWKLLYNMGFKGALSVHRHKLRLRQGQVFPPFLYVSIINSCNLRCQGCWVDVASKQEIIQPDAFHKLIREAKSVGNVFFGIVGGEPFMHPHLLDMLAEHPDCYFQIFTNG